MWGTNRKILRDKESKNRMGMNRVKKDGAEMKAEERE